MSNTDTPRTDAVMASSNWPYHITSEMKKLERELAASKAEVERLTEALKSCWHAANTYDGNYTAACDNVMAIAASAKLNHKINHTK